MPCCSMCSTDINLPLTILMSHTRNSQKMPIWWSLRWQNKRDTQSIKKVHRFKCIWTHALHSGNDIINDQANSQLIKRIIPKEALAGLLTLAKQEYESDSGTGDSSSLAFCRVHSSVKEAHCFASERDWLTTKGTQCSHSLYPQDKVTTFCWSRGLYGLMPWFYDLILDTLSVANNLLIRRMKDNRALFCD